MIIQKYFKFVQDNFASEWCSERPQNLNE